MSWIPNGLVTISGNDVSKTAGGFGYCPCLWSTSHNSGKYHFEMVVDNYSNIILGVVNPTFTVALFNYPGNTSSQGAGVQSNGASQGLQGSGTGAVGATYAVVIEIDFTNRKSWCNLGDGLWGGQSIAFQDPATNLGGQAFNVGLTNVNFSPAMAVLISGINIHMNSTGPFAVTPSAGFSAWDSPVGSLQSANTVINCG